MDAGAPLVAVEWYWAALVGAGVLLQAAVTAWATARAGRVADRAEATATEAREHVARVGAAADKVADEAGKLARAIQKSDYAQTRRMSDEEKASVGRGPRPGAGGQQDR